jgi:hypothetical protein
MASTDPQRWARVPPAIAWKRPGLPTEWTRVLERTDTPWYGSARLFRQPRVGDWSSVFEEVAAELRRLRGTAEGEVGGGRHAEARNDQRRQLRHQARIVSYMRP